MPTSPAAEGPPAFWQCPKCKTPNPWASYLTQCVACGGPRPARAAAPIFAPAPAVTPDPPRSGRWASILAWSYLGVVLVVLALVKFLGDRWWPATALLFAPRWLFLFPLVPMMIWAGIRRRWRALAVQGLTLVLVLWPLMGLRLPIQTLIAARPDGEMIRVLSLNRGAGSLDSRAFVQLVADGRYDLVCLQEARPDPVLDAYFATAKWHRDRAGTTWSKYPIVSDSGLMEEAFEVRGAWAARISRFRVRTETGREVAVANVHLPTMTPGFQALLKGDLSTARYFIDWRGRETDRLIAALRELAPAPLIVAGDFNMPPDSPFMARIREHYASGFEAVGWGFGYTRPSGPSWAGIDRVLASPGDFRFVSSRVGPQVGSDHRPIDAEMVLRAGK